MTAVEPRRFFGYAWAFLRLAEAHTRQRRTRIRDLLFSTLAHESFPSRPPFYRQVTKTAERQGAFAGGLWVGTQRLRALKIPAVDNFLAEGKSPVAPMRAFVGTTAFEAVRSGAISFTDAFREAAAKDVPVFRDLFGFDVDQLSFIGTPIVGSGVPHGCLWFGISRDPSLWMLSNAERAAALAAPLRQLPEVNPSWCPVGDREIPGEFALSDAVDVLETYASVVGLERVEKRSGGVSATRYTGAIDDVRGSFAAVAAADIDELVARLRALVSSPFTPDAVLACSPVDETAVAGAMRSLNSRLPQPLHIFLCTPASLRHRLRHLPWLWPVPTLPKKWLTDAWLPAVDQAITFRPDVEIGVASQFALFLAYWSTVAPHARSSVLWRCWRTITGLVERPLLDAFAPVVAIKDREVAFDMVGFVTFAPPASPADDFLRRIEEWITEHLDELPEPRTTAWLTRQFHQHLHSEWGHEAQPERALPVFRRVLTLTDLAIARETGVLEVWFGDVASGLRILSHVARRRRRDVEELCETVLDAAVAALRKRDMDRFFAAIAWPPLRRTQERRDFLSYVLCNIRDDALATRVVDELLRAGLSKQLVAEMELGGATRRFVRGYLKHAPQPTNSVIGAGVRRLTAALAVPMGAQKP